MESPNRGVAFNIQRWREYRFFVTAMIDWFSLPSEDRESLLADPWRFGRWLDSREHVHDRELRHIFLFLLFPDSFEPTLSARHKDRIAEAGPQARGHKPGPPSPSSKRLPCSKLRPPRKPLLPAFFGFKAPATEPHGSDPPTAVIPDDIRVHELETDTLFMKIVNFHLDTRCRISSREVKVIDLQNPGGFLRQPFRDMPESFSKLRVLDPGQSRFVQGVRGYLAFPTCRRRPARSGRRPPPPSLSRVPRRPAPRRSRPRTPPVRLPARQSGTGPQQSSRSSSRFAFVKWGNEFSVFTSCSSL